MGAEDLGAPLTKIQEWRIATLDVVLDAYEGLICASWELRALSKRHRYLPTCSISRAVNRRAKEPSRPNCGEPCACLVLAPRRTQMT